MTSLLVAAAGVRTNLVDLDVHVWQSGVLLALIVGLLLVDLLVFHRAERTEASVMVAPSQESTEY